jgi:hypothetical protein
MFVWVLIAFTAGGRRRRPGAAAATPLLSRCSED